MSMKENLAKARQGGDTWPMLIEAKLNKLYNIRPSESEERYGLHASAIIAPESEFCFRAQLLSLFFKMNQGEQLPTKLLRIFSTGNALHEKWYDLFRKGNIDVAIERSLFIKKYDLSFTIDALLDFTKPEYKKYIEGEGGEEIVCDVKSMNSFSFRKSKGHPSGEKQVGFYLWALSYHTKRKHTRGFVLRDSKDDSSFSVVPVYYDQGTIQPYIDRLKEIQLLKKDFVETLSVPCRRCTSLDSKLASHCSMRDACWKVGKGRIKLPKEVQPLWEVIEHRTKGTNISKAKE